MPLGFSVLTAAAVTTAVYCFLNKRRRRKEARITAEARQDVEFTTIALRYPHATALLGNQAGQPGPQLGTSLDWQQLPLLLAVARRLEEEEFQRGARRLTEVWEDQAYTKQQSRLESERRRAKRGLEEELKALVTARIGANAWKDGDLPVTYIYNCAFVPTI